MNDSFGGESRPMRTDADLNIWQLTKVQGLQDAFTDKQREILAYFNQKTGVARLASRTDLDPAELVSLLPNMTIFDVVMDETGQVVDLNFRLMGTAVAAFYGEHSGENFSDFGNNQIISRAMTIADHVMKERCAICSYADSVIEGQEHQSVFILFIPLVDDTGTITQFLCLFELVPNGT